MMITIFTADAKKKKKDYFKKVIGVLTLFIPNSAS